MKCECGYNARNVYILALHKHGKHQDDSLMVEHGYKIPTGNPGKKVASVEVKVSELTSEDLEFERIYATGTVAEVISAHHRIYEVARPS